MIKAPLILVLVFLAGYATQRGSTCAVSAAQEIVASRKATRFLGFLICACVSLAIMAIFHLAMLPVGNMAGEPPLSGVALLGGAIFGVGAYLNGRCAFGTIARLGSGDMSRLATIAAYVAGAALAAHLGFHPPSHTARIPMSGTSDEGLLAIAAAGGLAFGGLAGPAIVLRPAAGGWSTLRAMMTIGSVNGVLLLIAPGWTYTSLLAAIARGEFVDIGWHLLIAAALVLGAVAGAVIGKVFLIERGTVWTWSAAMTGGTLMGVGATMIPGGNDRMLMVGFPMLLANQIAAYAAMMATLLLMLAAIGKRQ